MKGARFSAFSSLFLTFLVAAAITLPVGAVQPAPQQEKPKPQQEEKKKQEQKPEEEKKPQSLREGLPQRELSEKERRKQQEALREELEKHFDKWITEDVSYIIMGEEREAFKELNTDEERESFIEQFWLRRDPTPDTVENEFKEEHYRRIAYANERFASGIPGWKTDRGRIYILHGEPAEIESYPAGGMYERSFEEGGGSTSVYPFERWRYRYIEGVGTDVILEFVDTSGSGEYRLTMDPSEKDALTLIPGAGQSLCEQMGTCSKVDRFTRTDGTRLPADAAQTARMNQFERLRTFSVVQKPPPVKFKDLEEAVETRISFNLLPFEVRTDYIRVTEGTVLVPVTIGINKRDLTFTMEDGIHRATVNVFARIHTLTGRIVQTFEDVISLAVPPTLFQSTLNQPALYQKQVPLRPGLYKLNVVVKDLNSGNVGTMETRLAVPRFEEQQLAHSSLIVADLIERVPTKNVGSGQFVLGETKVRPVLSRDLTPDDRMGIYLQVYNLGIDETSHKPNATIEYSILRDTKPVFQYSETTADLERAGQQVTLEKILPLATFQPGEYVLNIKVTDHISQQTIEPTTKFRVRK